MRVEGKINALLYVVQNFSQTSVTTQTAHTEKTETAGVYQEMKGQGSTTQILNQTRISGKVTGALCACAGSNIVRSAGHG